MSLTYNIKYDSNEESSAPVFFPITENATVQHILRVSQEASTEGGQQYTFVVFELAVAKTRKSLGTS